MSLPLIHSTALYLDLELNCWNGPPPPGKGPEIIEIGAVEMDLDNLHFVREAAYRIRPRHLYVSTRCTNLTGITEEDLKSAPRFPEVLARFIADFAPAEKLCCTWGRDAELLKAECQAHRLSSPLRNVRDIAQLFWHLSLLQQQPSLQKAVEMVGLTFSGVPHTALADARNTALIHAAILRKQRRQSEPIAEEVILPVERSTVLPDELGPLLANLSSMPQR